MGKIFFPDTAFESSLRVLEDLSAVESFPIVWAHEEPQRVPTISDSDNLGIEKSDCRSMIAKNITDAYVLLYTKYTSVL